jgi:hypothetical protein
VSIERGSRQPFVAAALPAYNPAPGVRARTRRRNPEVKRPSLERPRAGRIPRNGAARSIAPIAPAAIVLAAAALSGAGCVERLLQVRSDPPDADVFVNGELVGRTPLDHPFTFYGTVGVVVRRGGHESSHRLVALEAPWYETFPIDFFAELVVPWTIRDEHRHEVRLEPLPARDDPLPLESLAPRIDGARRRMSLVREAREARDRERGVQTSGDARR